MRLKRLSMPTVVTSLYRGLTSDCALRTCARERIMLLMTSVFRPVGEGGDWTRNGIFEKFHESDLGIAVGFADAARELVRHWLAGHPNDGHLLPIIWLYRHALELALKENIRDAAACLTGLGADDKELQEGVLDEWLRRDARHKLATLAMRLDELLTRLELENLPTETHDVLHELHTLDPAGDTFRYAKVWSPAHKRVVAAPRPETEHVDVGQMSAQFEEAFMVLAGGVATLLDNYREYLGEMRAESETEADWWT
ncbi:hypothetical protein SAMN05421879_1402 [Ornithinimicrobium cerasi]|uniref:Uncharacterized protein n=2 Tax=Ornithinimicrobium cerasi TaxID=2248773 RepID=A0A285VWI0_9MICO|nr:hypothetical protein SAMN05421879_1402 [Ornithinimicrobium cerasi]